jgi:hypothetical protein
MKHETSAVSDLWGFYMFLLGIYGVELFTKLQDLISACDSRFFCFVCLCITYVAILAIKKRNK